MLYQYQEVKETQKIIKRKWEKIMTKLFKDMVKVEKFEMVVELLKQANAPEQVVEFIKNERDMTQRKNERKKNGKRKPTKTQLENIELAKQVTEMFEAEKDLLLNNQEIGERLGIENATPQKITAIMKLVENVEKTEKDKKVAYKKA